MGPTVVFDTNILFSGLGWRGNPYQCLALAREQKVVSCTCREILEEFEEKLQTRLNYSPEEAADEVVDVLAWSQLVDIPNVISVVESDPDDNMVVECAFVAGADYVVSGDRHLLDLGDYQGTRVVTAREFLPMVRG